MTQITRVPRGLQHFLGTQAFGKNPSQFGDVVVPGIDIGRFLGIDLEQWYVEGVPLFNSHTAVGHVVPDGEIWVLQQIGAAHSQAAVTAGDNYTFSVSIKNIPNSNGGSNTHPISREPYTYTVQDPTVNSDEWQTWDLDNVIVWGGGTITWQFKQVVCTTGNFNPTAYCRYLRLEI